MFLKRAQRGSAEGAEAAQSTAGVLHEHGPLLLESAYLQEIFFSERKSLPGRGLRKPRAFFLQVDPLIWLGPFGFQPALPQGGRR